MIERLFLFFVSFFGIMSFFGIWMGYMDLIYPLVSALSIIVSVVVSYYLARRIKVEKLKYEKGLVLLLLIFLIVTLYSALPYFVFPHNCSDMYNHARSVRIVSSNHSFDVPMNYPYLFAHSYPQMYYGLVSQFYSIFGYTYVLNTVIPVFFELMSIIGLFLVARKIFDEKVAIVSVFIASFLITNLWHLEQGYLPQLMAQMFLMAAFYFYIGGDRYLLLISTVGLLSYPHYFAVFLGFLFFEFLKTRKFYIFLYPIVAFIFVLPESLGLFTQRLIPAWFNYMFLIRGGIFVPNAFSLAVFLFSLFGFYFLYRERHVKSSTRVLLNFMLPMICLMLATSSVFIVNFLFSLLEYRQIHQLYTAVKMFYLLLLPLSIVSAYGIMKQKGNIIYFVVFLLGFHFFYSVGYSYILPDRANFGQGFYYVTEPLNDVSGEFKVRLDDSVFLNDVQCTAPFLYRSLFDNPDDGCEYCKYIEIGRVFQYNWTSYRFEDGGVTTYNSKNESVVIYGGGDADYLVTKKSDDFYNVDDFGGFNLYRLNVRSD